MSTLSEVHTQNTAENSLSDLQAPAAERSMGGTGKITVGNETTSFAYKLRQLAEDVSEVVMNIGGEVGNAVRAIVRHPVLAATGATMGLAAIPGAQSESRGAVMVDGTTRLMMTSNNSQFSDATASISATMNGNNGSFNFSASHAWGPYYFIAKHEISTDLGIDFNKIVPGVHFVGGSNEGIGISRIDISPDTDFAIITAATTAQSDLSPSARLVGVAVAETGGSAGFAGSTIYVRLADPTNLNFINSVTGSHITPEMIANGQSIIADIAPNEDVWSAGFGVWGTPSTGLSDPDGSAGLWHGPVDGTGIGLSTYPSGLYFATTYLNDGGISYGDLNGHGANLDSGSPGITIVPEPSALGLLAAGITGALAFRRRRTES